MAHEELAFFIRGAFDPGAAARLCDELCGVPANTRVVVEFAGATEISVPALGILAAALAALDMRVRVRGLERFRLQLVGEWFPAIAHRADACSIVPGIGLELGF